jgi:hypothetical protein
MDEHDRLVERLRTFGRRSIAPDVSDRHLGAMRGAQVRAPRFVKLKVGVAFAAGLTLGGTGLASAGVLPAPVQSAAHGALAQVGVSVPNGHTGHGPARYNGPECTGGPYANHGQYVRSHPSDPNAGSSRCGKPVQAGNEHSTNGTEAPDATDAPDAPNATDAPNDQGGPPAGVGQGHGHGHHGKGEATPSSTVTTPAPRIHSSTTVPPTTAAPSTSTSTTTRTTNPSPTNPPTTNPSTTDPSTTGLLS